MDDIFGKKPKIPVNKKDLKAAILKANESLKKKNKGLESQVKEKGSRLKALNGDLKSLSKEVGSQSPSKKRLLKIKKNLK